MRAPFRSFIYLISAIALLLQLRREESAVRKGEVVERPAFLGPPGVLSREPAGAVDSSGPPGERRGCLQVPGRLPEFADEKLQS